MRPAVLSRNNDNKIFPVIANKPEVSLSTGLKVGFLLILFLLVGITLLGLSRMASINQALEQIVSENNVKTKLAYEMREAQRDRMIIMHTMALLTDVFEQQEELDRFNEYGANFIKARTRLLEKKLNAEEQKIIETMRESTLKIQPLVVQAIDLAMDGKKTESYDLIATEISPLQKQIASRISNLIQLQELETRHAAQEAGRDYRRTRLLMILFGGLATILGLIIAVVVIRHTNRQAQALLHQALFDNLTNLPNRVLFSDRLQQAILIGRREKQPFALLSMDLDCFKEINDTLGHHAGDQMLQHVATCVHTCLRESDTVARMGGDEFVILLATVNNVEGAQAVAMKILKSLEEPADIAGQKIAIGASLGIVMFPEHGEDPAQLIREADTAMYHAKQNHGGYKQYTKDMGEEKDDRMNLQQELRQAMTNNELVLHFQPKIDFEENCITGVEALVRWQHPKRGLIAPDRFIPIAEQSGMIKPLTYYVLRSALRQCEEWQRTGLDLSIAINVSAVNIQDPGFPAEVEKLLKESTVPPARLELEITETAILSEPKRAVDCIKKLGALGVQISVDDFGTGYASMSNLKELLVARIKIDKSFVKDLAFNHNDSVIVRSTVELGHNLGLKVVAEGVETKEAWDKLKLFGCDAAQGYYMGRPLSPDDLTVWMQQSPWGLKERDS